MVEIQLRHLFVAVFITLNIRSWLEIKHLIPGDKPTQKLAIFMKLLNYFSELYLIKSVTRRVA